MTEFKVGDKVRITCTPSTSFLRDTVGRTGTVSFAGGYDPSIEIILDGEKVNNGDRWWYHKDDLTLIEEEEKTVTKFEEGEKVRLLPGARSAASSEGAYDIFAEHGAEATIISGPDFDDDYYVKSPNGYTHYVAAEFVAKIEEFPRPIEFADVKVGDRILARRPGGQGSFLTYEDTIREIENGDLYGENWFINSAESMGYVLTLLEREPEFTAEQTDAIEALVKAGFTQESAEEIVKKGDSA